jgi:hypothetical protein
MGLDILGWVEVQELHGPWQGVIRVDPVVNGRNYPMYEYLFGTGRWRDAEVPPPPVAPRRGYPQDISREAIKEILGNDLEEYFEMTVALSLLRDDHTFGGATYISYEEIVALNPTDFIGPKHRRLRIMDDQWRSLFRLMAILAEWHTPSHVRLVVWFNG